jgi:serpin B
LHSQEITIKLSVGENLFFYVSMSQPFYGKERSTMILARKHPRRRDLNELQVGHYRTLRLEPLEDRRLLSANRAAEAINQFAYDIYEHMQNTDGNLFYSPLSMATALTMAYAGAAGQTATEMANVLHVGSEPGIHASYGDLISLLASQTNPAQGFEIEVANAMWPQLGMPLQSEFVDIVENLYDGYAQGVNYGNPSLAEDIINDWVSDKTHGKIEDLVSNLTPDTAMVLTNALYFKALWKQPFDPQHTYQGSFEVSEGEYVTVPMMHTQAFVRQKSLGGFRIMAMPFAGNSASMVFVVPQSWTGPALSEEVIEAIDTWLKTPLDEEEWGEDDIYLPKFEITVSTGFNQLLEDLGMPTAFSGGANFSNMIDGGGVFIDKVFHKATITLNEQGTEAAAATEVQFAICFAAGTPVMTPEGEKRIEELQAGDYVLARDEHNLEGPVEPRMIERTLHGEANIVELQVGGQSIRTTELHPFFVRGRGWISAGEIKVEDRLSTNHGDWIEVEKVLHTEKSEAVFNLRVAGHRTYFIGSRDWKFGVWVHNNYYDFEANRPFHFFIRDNATSTITFMGRINDPTQSENEVVPTAPTVSPTSADFDGDGDIDGRDFLAWQRGFGMTTGATLANGDSNADGDVDSNDLATWQETYGQSNTLSEIVAVSDFEEAANASAIAAVISLPDSEFKALSEETVFVEAGSGEQVAVDRVFDHWVPPHCAVQDFGDFVARRTLKQVGSTAESFV